MPALPAMSRRRFLGYGAVAAASAAVASLPGRAFAGSAPGAQESPAPLATVSATPSQTMQGFGASGAWWPNDLVKLDPEVREAVADMLFGQSGIELSVYRYNIGGGGVAVTNPVRAPETFLVSPGTYDWGRDPGGRLFLRLAAERGVPILIGFVNSAPAAWTTNGESCGGSLKPGAEGAFAGYLVDVVTHFHDTDGITLSYLSPMNEPDTGFPRCGQEGMAVPVEQRAVLVQAVGRELAARAAYCRLTADESSRTGEQFMHEVSQWLSVDDTADYVAALAQHRYDFPHDPILRLARELSEDYDKPIWCTEVCCVDSRTGAWGKQYDPTIRGALMMANIMWQGLTVANDAAFHWWVACSSEMGSDPSSDPDAAFQANGDGWNDGLLYYDPNYAKNGNQQIYATKRYYAMGNFSRYVRPGDQRHDVASAPRNLHVMAFATPAVGAPAAPSAQPAAAPPPVQLPAVAPPAQPPADGTGPSRGWSLVIINNARAGSNPTPFTLQLPVTDSTRLVSSVAVETSDTRDLEPVELPSVSATGMLSARIPAQSITTYVLHSSPVL
jgi:O-glycosyl hydrolase